MTELEMRLEKAERALRQAQLRARKFSAANGAQTTELPGGFSVETADDLAKDAEAGADALPETATVTNQQA